MPLGLLCITAALVLDDKNRAVMAFYSGCVMLAFFIGFFAFMRTLIIPVHQLNGYFTFRNIGYIDWFGLKVENNGQGSKINRCKSPQNLLILTGLIHAGVGYEDFDMGNESCSFRFFLLTTFTMLYAAFLTEGEQQARLATVIAGPIWVWFVVCVVQGYTLDYEGETFTFEFRTSIKNYMGHNDGIVHGNFQELTK